MHKDSTGHVGVVVKKGKIVSLAKDSSAARNGLLTHHYICEVNGQNVIGMKVRAQPCTLSCPRGTTARSEGSPAVGTGFLGADCGLGAHGGAAALGGAGIPTLRGCEVGMCRSISRSPLRPQDKQLMEVLAGAGNVITLTIIPAVIYEHMVKR